MKKFLITLIFSALFLLSACTVKSPEKSIAVFVPGICDDSPTYAMMVEGVKKSVEKYNSKTENSQKVNLFVMEAGTNQAEWGSKILALAAEQKYQVIISSNPSIPDLLESVLELFPNQKFIVLDATKEGNQNIHTVCYNQYEAAWLTGYIAGLMSKSHKTGIIAAQEYPVMNNIIAPYFAKGCRAAYDQTSVDFRVVGNWYDASKASEIADALYKKGVDVILPICGGASQGVISSAVNNGIYITWFDNNGFSRAPKTVISSCTMEQSLMAEKVTDQFLEGKTPWGSAKMEGLKEGFVKFIDDDPNYLNTVPSDVQEKLKTAVEQIKSGSLKIK